MPVDLSPRFLSMFYFLSLGLRSFGDVAQLVVRPLGLREVTGSSPVFSTMGSGLTLSAFRTGAQNR